MSFYLKMAATAQRLLTKFGAPVTLQRYSGRSTDPVTGVVTAGTDASVTTTGLLKPFPDSLIDGERVLASDRMLILSAEQVPQPTDKPVIGGQNWAIVEGGITTVSPAGTDIVYFVQVRR